MPTKKEKEEFDFEMLIRKIEKTKITKSKRDLEREKMIKLVNENRDLKNIINSMKAL